MNLAAMGSLLLLFSPALSQDLARPSVRSKALAAFVKGEVLVSAIRGMDLEVKMGLGQIGLEVLEQDVRSGLMRLSVPNGQEVAWTQLLGTWPAIRYAETNGLGRGGYEPDDTSYFRQWHLANTDLNPGFIGADIQAQGAWNVTTGSSSIVVAVLDTGIDSDHPDFAGRIHPAGMDFVNGDNNPEADHPHGTWVSGCLGANGDNGFGVAGVDWNCRILPIKVLDANNAGTTFNLAQALNYVAVQPDVQVISMSLINYPGNMTLINALQGARDAGKILMACAGNGGLGNADVSFPGASPLTISIGATTAGDARASFSGTGSALDFVAPGSSIVTTKHGSNSSTAVDTVSGCSFATPIASGIVSLLLALAEERGLTLDQDGIYDLLLKGAEDQVGIPSQDTPGRDNFHGHGRLNAFRSLGRLLSSGQKRAAKSM